jgi:cytochrome c heme-lyase
MQLPSLGWSSSLWWPYTLVPSGTAAASSSSCPVASASLEEAAQYAQTPHVDQTIPLATHRQVSNIPRGDIPLEALPLHQHALPNSTTQEHKQEQPPPHNWIYPSEQQLYNAMRRKGWQNIPQDAIPYVLHIHNTTNERTWQHIQQWEGTHQVRLVSFQGRPRDLTPLAFVYSRLLRLCEPPFDRHDWYVQRLEDTATVTSDSAGATPAHVQRYVIDYYEHASADPNIPPTTLVDVRPAIDHPRALALRAQHFVQAAFPGITAFVKQKLQGNDNGNSPAGS